MDYIWKNGEHAAMITHHYGDGYMVLMWNTDGGKITSHHFDIYNGAMAFLASAGYTYTGEDNA